MKKIYYTIGILLLLLACTKDFDDVILDSFEFNFTVISEDNGFIYEGSKTDFRVVPERTITTTKFMFNYVIEEGDGFFQDPNGKVLEQHEDLELDELLWDLNYIPTTTGTHRITVKAKDQKDNEKTEVIVYQVDYAPFTTLFNKGANSFIVNQENDLNLTVVSETNTELYETLSIEDVDTSYTLSFTVEGGTGTFIINGESYDPGQNVSIGEGTLEFDYIPSTVGEHVITLIATAPDGAIREQQIVVLVENVQFFILANTPSNTLPIGETIDVSISLQSSDSSDEIDYDLAFFYATDSEGVGTLMDENGNPQTAGQPREIEPGNYTYSFTSNVLGQKKLYFDVSDSNNQVKRDSILVNVTSIPFSFSGQPSAPSSGINQPLEINLSLSTNAPEGSSIDYNISFEQNEGNGQLKDLDDQIIPPNTAYDVTPGVFKLVYTPYTLGEHILTFVATDSYGQSITSEIDIMATNAQLSFTAAATNGEIIMGNSNTISVNLGEQGNTGGLSYEMNYFVTGGTGTLYENGDSISPSTYFETTPGSRTFSFTPDLPGNYTVTFMLRDSNGQILEAPVSFVVSNTNFQFTANEANAEVGLGQNNNINFNIVPGTTNNGTSYTMTYDSSGNGTLSINGVPYGPGQTITVSEGSFQGIYNPTRTGDYTLDFTVQDSNGVVRTDSSNFSVSNSDFVVNAAASPSQINADASSTINIDVSQVVPNPSASYEMSYSVQGGSGLLSGPNGQLQPGVFTPIGTGSSSWVYTPSTEGSHAITIVVRDNGGTVKDETVIVTVAGRDFNFSAVATGNNSNIGQGVPVNLNIDEIGGNGGTYDIIVATTGNGRISYNGNSYTAGEPFTVNGGSSSFTYIGESEGAHNLTVTATASYGPTKTANTSINFNSLEYTFTAAAQNPSITVGETTLVNFNISESVGNSTYQIRYALSGQNASMAQNGAQRSPGNLYPASVGNFSWTLTGQEVGTVNITFTVINANGLERTQTVQVNVVSRDYNFTATEAQGTANVGQDVGITFNIQETVSGIDTYTAVYSTSGTGTLSYNGNTITPGSTFTIPAGTSSAIYNGTSGGAHNIEVTVLSSSGTQKTDTARINFNSNDFTFTAASTSTNALLGDPIDINFNINESVPGIDTYTMIYNTSETGTLVYNGQTIQPGNSFVISAGNTTAEYTAATSGNHRIEFVVTSSNSDSASDNVQIDFDNSDFTFSADGPNNFSYGSDMTVNFDINQLGGGAYVYEMSFSTTGNGVLTYNGNTYNQGETFIVPTGGFVATYNEPPTTGTGDQTLTFTVVSTSGNTKSDNFTTLFTVRDAYIEFASLDYVTTERTISNTATSPEWTNGDEVERVKHHDVLLTLDGGPFRMRDREDEALVRFIIINGIRYQWQTGTYTLKDGPELGYIYDRFNSYYNSTEAYYDRQRHTVNDDNVTLYKKGSGQTLSFQVELSDGRLSNTIQIGLPNSYGLSYPSSGSGVDVVGNVVTVETYLNGNKCNTSYGFGCTF
ncbi:TraQ conjugal transfer family protein [Croceivirga sp. JEA036]|uniref:TraQ conjugal transfer family protein n=1 Tax=Croceivirga sp. JEA036 TaxID=2721162 RepID=UPI00143C9BD9|nr:TraQ conjugal transfer family protein [Croceivirga sp. JEA036]NJB38100.1 DUF3872 domain-containing protein [Croceivirga sp. JEA036]